MALGMDLPGTQVLGSHLRRQAGHVTSLSRVTDILMGESQGHRVTPETLPAWEADWMDRMGLRPLFPSHCQVKWAADGLLDQGQTGGGQAG